MNFKLKAIAAAAALALSAGVAQAQISGNVVKIGILTDMSSLYADLSGQGSVLAAKMAIEDFKAKEKGLNVEVVFADHQNKADVGSQIANKWYDSEGVDVIVDTPNSGVALAVNQITKDKGKVFINSGAASSDLTGKACSPNTVHWTYDTWMLANGTGKAIVKTGGDTWFFITADYAFGHALERDTEAVVVKNGGKVVGKGRAPINTQEFSSFLLQEQALRGRERRQVPVDGAGGGLRGRAALPEGGRGAEERRRHEGGGEDERDAHRRSALRQGLDPRRWPQDPSGVPGRSEEALRVQGTVRLLQDPLDDPGERGFPPDHRG